MVFDDNNKFVCVFIKDRYATHSLKIIFMNSVFSKVPDADSAARHLE